MDRALPTAPPLFASVDDVVERLAETGYLADKATATAVFLADRLGKPLLIEGPAGVGKTELARAVAQTSAAELVRLQCYEGVDESRALYEWNHAKQILRIQAGSDHSWDATKQDVFSEEFLLSRPLLTAIRREDPTVLLIDEVDKADVEIEGLLLEVLSDFAVTIPELGTITATRKPFAVLTSNATRELSEALSGAACFLHLDFPTPTSSDDPGEPGARTARGRRGAAGPHGQRAARHAAQEGPSVSETIDWGRTLLALGLDTLDDDAVRATMVGGCSSTARSAARGRPTCASTERTRPMVTSPANRRGGPPARTESPVISSTSSRRCVGAASRSGRPRRSTPPGDVRPGSAGSGGAARGTRVLAAAPPHPSGHVRRAVRLVVPGRRGPAGSGCGRSPEHSPDPDGEIDFDALQELLAELLSDDSPEALEQLEALVAQMVEDIAGTSRRTARRSRRTRRCGTSRRTRSSTRSCRACWATSRRKGSRAATTRPRSPARRGPADHGLPEDGGVRDPAPVGGADRQGAGGELRGAQACRRGRLPAGIRLRTGGPCGAASPRWPGCWRAAWRYDAAGSLGRDRPAAHATQSMSTGGCRSIWCQRKPRPARPELVLLCDVSGSVAGFSPLHTVVGARPAGAVLAGAGVRLHRPTDEVTRFFDTGADLGVVDVADDPRGRTDHLRRALRLRALARGVRGAIRAHPHRTEFSARPR